MKRIVVFALVLNAALLGVIARQLVAIAGGGAVATQNGDTNGDGARDITDAVYLLSWLFTGGDEPVALAQQGGNDEEVAQLRAMVTNMFRDFEGLREDLHPVAFSGNYEELENVPAAPGGDCCEQGTSWLTDIIRTTPNLTFNVVGHNFDGVDLAGVVWPVGEVLSSSFRNADLRGSDLSTSQFRDVDFREANLAGALVRGATNSNFEGTNLQGVFFSSDDNRVFDGSNFRGADLTRLDFSPPRHWGTYFRAANFSGANLSFVNFTGARLQWTNMTGANLQGANLQDADLRGAIGVNLEGTVGTPAFMPGD